MESGSKGTNRLPLNAKIHANFKPAFSKNRTGILRTTARARQSRLNQKNERMSTKSPVQVTNKMSKSDKVINSTQVHRQTNRKFPQKPSKTNILAKTSISSESSKPKVRVEDVMQKRREKVKELCNKGNPKSRLTRSEYFYRWIFVNEELKLLGCAIPKSGSTYMKRLIAHDHDYLPTFDKKARPSLEKYGEKKRGKILSKYTKLLLVRHPFDRLWSAYTSKIMQAREDMGWIARKAVKIAREDPSKHEKKCADDVSFNEFVKLIIHEYKHDNDFDPHWEKYRTLCHPCLMRYDVILHLENFDSEVQYFYNFTKMDQKLVESWTKSSSSFESMLEAACRLNVEFKCGNLTEMVERNYNYFVIEGIVDSQKDRAAIIPPLTQWVKSDFSKKHRYGCVDTLKASFANYTEQQSVNLIKHRKALVRDNAFKQLKNTERNLLKEIYKNDFEIFGYDPDVMINK